MENFTNVMYSIRFGSVLTKLAEYVYNFSRQMHLSHGGNSFVFVVVVVF